MQFPTFFPKDSNPIFFIDIISQTVKIVFFFDKFPSIVFHCTRRIIMNMEQKPCCFSKPTSLHELVVDDDEALDSIVVALREKALYFN